MSEAEERQIKATALLEYHEAKQALVLLEIEASQIADDLEGLAKLLRNEPYRIENPDGKLPPYKTIYDLALKVTRAADDLAQRKDRVEQLGLTV